jgi:hypothetical protein
MREPIHNDVAPSRVDRRLLESAHRLHRWRATALTATVLLAVVTLFLVAEAGSRDPVQAAGVAAAFQATDQPATKQYQSEQAKAEIALLRSALVAADKAVDHGRHHSEVMWDLMAGRINAQEAWWQGGDSTCAGWVAAGEYEVAVAKLKGKQVTPPPVPAEGLKFCKQARDRK